MPSLVSHKLSIIKYVVLKKIIFYFLCFNRLIWTWTWTWTWTRTSLDSVLTRTRTSLDSVLNLFGLGLDSDSNLFGLGLVLDSTKVDLTTALLGVPRALCQHAESILAPAWGWEPASREIAWRWKPASREIEPRLTCLPCAFSGKAALFSWRFFRDCSDSGRRIQRYVIWDYYTCARCSYGWNLESRGRRRLRDVCASRPHRSSDATQITSAGEFPCAR